MLKHAFLWMIAVFVSGPAMSQELDVYSSRQQLQYFTNEPLPERSRKSFREFRSAKYYGAFAYNPATGSTGFHRGVHSISYAQQAALRICRFFSEERKEACKLYAQITPRGYQHKAGAETLSQAATESYLRGFQEGLRDDGVRHLVFTIAPEGAWAWKTRTAQTSFSNTRRQTLERCRELSAKDRSNDLTWWTESLGSFANYRCKVVVSITR